MSRLSPSITAEKVKEFASEIIGSTCNVEKLQTKFTSYSSFCISCEVQYREIILDPNMWESGVLVRPFYGSLLRADGETPVNS